MMLRVSTNCSTANLFGMCCLILGLSHGIAQAQDRYDSARIVSVGGAVTEIIYALGLEKKIVAIDTTSQYPPAAKELPNVGYMRRLSAEPILSLSPTLVLAIEDAGPETALDQLREAGVPVVTVPDKPSPAGALAKIERIAQILGDAPNGARLKEKLTAEFEKVRHVTASESVKPKVLFLLSIGQGRPPMAAGRETAAAGIIEMAGGRNAIDSYDGYKPLSPEAVAVVAPDIILVTERSMKFLGGAEKIAAMPAIRETPAGRSRRIVAMDGLFLLGFGPRTGQAAMKLARHIHPEKQ